MTQCWLHDCCAGSLLLAALGQQWGGSREPLAAGEHWPDGVGEGRCRDTPLARKLELSLYGSVLRAASTSLTHSAMGVEDGLVLPASQAARIPHPFSRGDLRAWLRGKQCCVLAGSGQDSTQLVRSRHAHCQLTWVAGTSGTSTSTGGSCFQG